MPDAGAHAELLPPRFAQWFADRGWQPRAHQLAMVEKAREGRDTLLIAPTGGGKTLAGFLPCLIELAARPPSNTPRGQARKASASPSITDVNACAPPAFGQGSASA